jgi:hypothetical protein
MKLRSVLTSASALALVGLFACNTPSSGGGGGATTTTTGATATASGGGGAQIAYSKKMPGKGSRAVTQKAVRGGGGDTRPSANSTSISEKGTDRAIRKHADVDKIDCTAANMNLKAECDGTSLYFCSGQKLWLVECDREAKLSGLAGGACFEGEKFIDCLGCDKADDGTDACCDFQMSVCCDKDGNCYSPK